jgi:hypothetical protein
MVTRTNNNLKELNIMKKSLIVKSNIQEIKRVCEERGVNYEIYQEKKPNKPRITDQQLKEAYQKLSKSKNYEKEMQL